MKCFFKKNFLIGLFLFCVAYISEAQNIDSLKQVLKNAKHDTARVKTYVELSEVCDIPEIAVYAQPAADICQKNIANKNQSDLFRKFYLKNLSMALNNLGFAEYAAGNLPKANEYYLKSLKQKEELNDKEGIVIALNNIGRCYDHQGQTKEAILIDTRCVKLAEELHDKVSMARALNNLGVGYCNLGDMQKGIELYHKALKVEEEVGNKKGIATILLNIGVIYYNQSDTTKALNYFLRGQKLFREIKDQQGESNSYLHTGFVYMNKKEFAKATECFQRSFELKTLIDDKLGLAKTLYYMGVNCNLQNNYKDALAYSFKSLEIRERIDDRDGMAGSLLEIAKDYYGLKNYKDAKKYAERSFEISKKLGYPENITNISKLLSLVYAELSDYKNAYAMQLLHKQMSDSIKNESIRKASIQKGFQYEYEKKAAADSVKIIEERKVVEAQRKQERAQRNMLYFVIALVVLFSGFMYNRFRVTNKQKQIIEIQKVKVDEAYEELNQQNEEISAQRDLIEEQKYVVEEKQKEIIDSIQYASRIQKAMLTSEEYISEHFKAEYFILYQPKDIVSGDFYWATKAVGSERLAERFYIATADCTGHGVPGAFMSLLNISFLNENVIERRIFNTDKILNEQRKEIINALNPKGDENSKDGMDCVLCAFDLENLKLEFAAANNPLWLVRDKALQEFKADKMPVGKYEENAKDFRTQSIDLKKGDVIYTFTDGYADQFGGPKGKKFKYKQLEELLLANHHLPMQEQKEILLNTINNWKGNAEQVDDILVIGVRI